MIPIAATNSGTLSVEATEASTDGYAVHATTITKMSQTWLASQTGPIAWRACSRSASSRRWDSRIQMPAPKSAPASTAYAASPTRMKISGSSFSMRRLLELERDPAHPPQDPRHRARQGDVDEHQRR